jgi:hypothetical protein
MNDFEKILDECINRINRGDSIDSCLADYPELARQLRPMLQALLSVKEAYSFVPSPGAKKAARERFNIALENSLHKREESQPRFAWLQGWPKVWATAAAGILVIAAIVYIGIRLATPQGETTPYPEPSIAAPSLEPEPSTVVPSPQPEPSPVMLVVQPSLEGNFVFLISDDVNAIDDFESVSLSISKVSLLRIGNPDELVEFEPEQGEVDLTLVQGDKTQEIWRGNMPEGQYTSVSIQVSSVLGILKETGEEIEIKLPGDKLRISKDFQISDDILTTFTYDLTVVAAGSPQSGIKYILKPQADQSGATNKPITQKEKAKKEKPDNK